MEYADRTDEYNEINGFITADASLIIVYAASASGVSSFFKVKFSSRSIFILNCRSEITDISHVLIENMDEITRQAFREWYISEYGKRDTEWISNLLSIIPYVGAYGRAAAKVFQSIKNGKKCTNYHSHDFMDPTRSILIHFLSQYAKQNRLGFVFDNAQFIGEHDYKFIRDLINIKHVYVILVFTDSGENVCKIENELNNPESYIVKKNTVSGTIR